MLLYTGGVRRVYQTSSIAKLPGPANYHNYVHNSKKDRRHYQNDVQPTLDAWGIATSDHQQAVDAQPREIVFVTTSAVG